MDRLAEIAHRFRKQQEFTVDYAPLYSHLFGLMAAWCERPDAGRDPVIAWLLEASAGRQAFDVPLLLLAALHRDVLAKEPAVAELARYYPTAEGDLAVRTDDIPAALGEALRAAILARREALHLFIQSVHVQTNETGRGFCWLLPLLFTNWTAVHLLDLGASAGLNLVADQRAYRFVNANTGARLLDVGAGTPEQFVVLCRGETPLLETTVDMTRLSPPRIVSRRGCDAVPFALKTKADELQLMSYIWADHPERLERLREGLDALRHVKQTDRGVQLHQVRLPHDLGPFLQTLPDDGVPLILYNTYITRYFLSEAHHLEEIIAAWAQAQTRPIAWLQWEPFLDRDKQALAPQFGWCAWTADLWLDGRRHQWHFGWVHPHGSRLKFLPHFRAWRDLWS